MTRINNPGSKLIYRAATGLERALADVEGERLIDTYAELPIDQWDPFKISSTNLPYLAFAMGVTLWEDIWSEATKRDWVARQWLFKSLRGTPAGIRMALEPSGYDVTEMARPPQGFIASPELTKAEFDRWIHLMPELRITFAPREGTRRNVHWFLDTEDLDVQQANVGFPDWSFATPNDGWVLYGRLGVIRQNNADTPIHTVEYRENFELRGKVDYERYSTIGDGSLAWIGDHSFADGPSYVDADNGKGPQLYTLAVDRSYLHDVSEFSLTTIIPDLEPVSPRYERNSDVGEQGPWIYADHYVPARMGSSFSDRVDGGDRMLADRIFLHDPEVAAPMNAGNSFADISRVGIEPYTAEIQVDLATTEPRPSFFAEESISDAHHVVPEDPSHRERAFRAVRDAKALRDTILVSFAPRRQLQMGDYMTAATRYGDWVRADL